MRKVLWRIATAIRAGARRDESATLNKQFKSRSRKLMLIWRKNGTAGFALVGSWRAG
jgi:hypothetical protein